MNWRAIDDASCLYGCGEDSSFYMEPYIDRLADTHSFCDLAREESPDVAVREVAELALQEVINWSVYRLPYGWPTHVQDRCERLCREHEQNDLHDRIYRDDRLEAA